MHNLEIPTDIHIPQQVNGEQQQMVKLFIILANTATLGFLTGILSAITGEARSSQVLM